VSVRPSVRPSLRLSVGLSSFAHQPPRAAGLLLCIGSPQAMSIDCCTARLLQERPPFDPRPQQHGSHQQKMREFSFLIGEYLA